MIGIFDSGSGGLSVMKAVREVLPSADVLYFGDIKNAPYGTKDHRELTQLTIAAIKRLQERNVEHIVSACNSVSASMAVSLFDAFSLKPDAVIEMVGPTVAYFKGTEARIALCATEATIRSGMYESAFGMIGVELQSIAIPDLARAVEFGESEVAMSAMIREALTPALGTFDVLILACTHYPLVTNLFTEVIGPDVAIFDPAHAVAQRAHKLFWPQEVGEGSTTFLISQPSAQFETYVQRLFPGMTYTLEVVE